jgi:serine/threonine protein kinase
VDIFALGTMFYELYSGEIPYQGIDPSDIKEKVLKDSSLPLRNGMNKAVLQISKGFMMIVNKCRVADVDSRPTIEELVKFQEW